MKQHLRLAAATAAAGRSVFFQAKAAVGDYKEAEEVFLLIQNEKIKNDYVFLSWLARCCE